MKVEDQAIGEATAVVTRSRGRKKEAVGEDSDRQEVGLGQFEIDPTADIDLSVGRTISLPGYQSLRVDLRMRIPAKSGTVEAVYEKTRTWLIRRLKELEGDARDAFNRLPTPVAAPEDISFGSMEVPYAEIEVRLGMTVSMGEKTFEFIRSDVGLKLPVKPGELVLRYGQARGWVANRLQELAEALSNG